MLHPINHQMRKKIVSLAIILTAPLLLVGCFWWSSSVWQDITFDTFNLTLDETYESIPPSLVENKQIINKVLRSFKITNPEWFDKNLVITKSTIDPSLNFDQFATANEQKLRSQLVWYAPWEKEIYSFMCLEEEITWVMIQFEVTDTFYQWTSQYYIHQYQFVANEYWYIISYATDEAEQEKLFKNIIKSLECW